MTMKYSPSHITYNIHIFSLTITIYLFIYTHLIFSNKNLYYSPNSFHLTEIDLLWNICHCTFSAYSTLFCKIFWHLLALVLSISVYYSVVSCTQMKTNKLPCFSSDDYRMILQVSALLILSITCEIHTSLLLRK